MELITQPEPWMILLGMLAGLGVVGLVGLLFTALIFGAEDD